MPLPEQTDSHLPPKSGCKVPGTQVNDSQTALFFLCSRGRRIEMVSLRVRTQRALDITWPNPPGTAVGCGAQEKEVNRVSDRAGTKTSSPSSGPSSCSNASLRFCFCCFFFFHNEGKENEAWAKAMQSTLKPFESLFSTDSKGGASYHI